MSPRSFWIILLKLVGVWILFSGLTVIPNSFAQYYPGYSLIHFQDDWEVFALAVITMLVYLWVVYVLVFTPEEVINKLKLDKGFSEERLDFNMHRSVVVTIAIIILGGLMVIDSVPVFFRQLFLFYESQTESKMGPPANPTWLFVYLCKILIGYLLVVNNRGVVNFIEKTRRTPGQPAGEPATDNETTETNESN